MTREEVVQQIRAGHAVAFLTDRGAISTRHTGGVDLLPLASRLYFEHRNYDRLFVDGVMGSGCVSSTEDGDPSLDQFMHDQLCADLPEPPRDPHIEPLFEELMQFHGPKTPMQRQVLREMATKIVYDTVCQNIAAKLGGIN